LKICNKCRGISLGTEPRCPECGTDISGERRRFGDDLLGLVLERKYELVEFLGDGSMGWVYRALNRRLNSSVAIKIMKPQGAGEDTRARRFRREAEASASLNHPNIVSVIDFGQTAAGLLYIVSEFVPGTTLSYHVEQQGRMSLPRAVRVFNQILSAVEEAHGLGIVHRDLKPENIMVTPMRSGESRVKVLDFGIAKLLERDSASTRLSLKGQIFGTPGFMAPEQIDGGDVSPLSDVYACGALLYYILTGREIFTASSPVEIILLQLHSDPEPLRAASQLEFPEQIERLVARCLQRAPQDRFSSVAELREAFAEEIDKCSHFPCPSCGTQLEILSRFCGDCGLPVGERDSGYPSGSSRPASGKSSRPGSVPSGRRSSGPSAGKSTGRSARLFARTLDRRLRVERTLDLPLVDRDTECDALADFLNSGRNVLAVVGPAGSGKTALLSVLGKMARESDRPVASSGPDPGMARQPWFPIRSVLGQVLGTDEFDLKTLKRSVEDADLAPEDVFGLSQLLGVLAEREKPEYAVRLREATASARRVLLSSRMSGLGLCLIFDEVEEFDDASNVFLRGLCAAAAGKAVKVVLTAESESAILGLAEQVIRPGPVSREGAEQLARAILPSKGSSWKKSADAIVDAAAGNALHLVHALRLMAEGGSEVDVTRPDLIALRIGRLPAPPLKLLQIVCTMGLAAPPEMVKTLYKNGEPWDPALKLLVRRGLVLPETDKQLVVSHKAIVQTVREQMPAVARRELHRRVVELSDPAVFDPISLARHAYEARMGDMALEIVQRAAELSEECLDDSGAALYFRRALHIARWQLLMEPDDGLCLELSLKLADSMRYSRDTVGVELVLKEAIDAAVKNPLLHAQLLRSMARFELGRDRSEEALRVAQQAVGRAYAAGSTQLLAESYLELSRVLASIGDLAGAANELEEGLHVAANGVEGGDTTGATLPGLWRLYVELAELRSKQKGDIDLALETARDALNHARRERSVLGEARCRYLLGTMLTGAGRLNAGEKELRAALQSFIDLGDRRSAGECLLGLAEARGDTRDELAERARDMFQQISWRQGLNAVNRFTENAVYRA
jgi:serine/threonine protein kinase/tetratricopeptide (TPR) repeat protein